jgi:hypothetical protein
LSLTIPTPQARTAPDSAAALANKATTRRRGPSHHHRRQRRQLAAPASIGSPAYDMAVQKLDELRAEFTTWERCHAVPTSLRVPNR